ncbi:hypothetical protein [Thermococcus prieurii]
MKKGSTILLTVVLIVIIGLGVNYAVSHYGFRDYEWKSGFMNYKVYRLIGNSTLNGYVKADGEVSVYILTKEDFKRLKEGEPFSYYKAWEHVKTVELNDVKIPDRDYLLVIKNEEKGMQWISVKLVDKK